MGEVVLAAKITHVPSMFISQKPGKYHGCRQEAIDGLKKIGDLCRERNVDKIVISDTHWLVNAGFHINANPVMKGVYSSTEFPQFLTNLEYSGRVGPLHVVNPVRFQHENMLAYRTNFSRNQQDAKVRPRDPVLPMVTLQFGFAAGPDTHGIRVSAQHQPTRKRANEFSWTVHLDRPGTDLCTQVANPAPGFYESLEIADDVHIFRVPRILQTHLNYTVAMH